MSRRVATGLHTGSGSCWGPRSQGCSLVCSQLLFSLTVPGHPSLGLPVPTCTQPQGLTHRAAAGGALGRGSTAPRWGGVGNYRCPSVGPAPAQRQAPCGTLQLQGAGHPRRPAQGQCQSRVGVGRVSQLSPASSQQMWGRSRGRGAAVCALHMGWGDCADGQSPRGLCTCTRVSTQTCTLAHTGWVQLVSGV